MSGGKAEPLPRIDVGLADDCDVAIIAVDESGSIAFVCAPDDAEAHARLVLMAAARARQNRKRMAQ